MGNLIGLVSSEKDGLTPKDGFFSMDIGVSGISLNDAPLGCYRASSCTDYPSDSPYNSGIVVCFGGRKDSVRFILFVRPEGFWVRTKWNAWGQWQKII